MTADSASSDHPAPLPTVSYWRGDFYVQGNYLWCPYCSTDVAELRTGDAARLAVLDACAGQHWYSCPFGAGDEDDDQGPV